MQGLRALLARRASIAPPAQIRKLSSGAGTRERILLDASLDPDLAPYKSTKKTVKAIKTLGDVLVLLVVAGNVYEIGYRVQARKAANAEAAMVQSEAAEKVAC